MTETEHEFEMDAGLDLEATTDVHLVDPVSGEPWYDDTGDGTDKKPGNPVTVTVISGMGETFKRDAFNLQRRYRVMINKNKGPDKGFANYDQQRNYQAELYALIMRGWFLTKRQRGPHWDVPFTRKNAINWCLANPLFASQLSSGSDDLEKFLEDAEGNFTSENSGGSTKSTKRKSA